MSRIRADKFVNSTATGAPQLTLGAEVPVGYSITGAGGINITGVVTATSFSGDGSGLTSVGIGSTGSINTTGIITATSFSGDGSSLTGIAGFTSARSYTFNQLFS